MADVVDTYTISYEEAHRTANNFSMTLWLLQDITTNGKLKEEYKYLYSDLFVIFNRIYNGGAALDNSINNNLLDEINNDFEKIYYHVGCAKELAISLVDSPEITCELNNAKEWSDKLQGHINQLGEHSSEIIKNEETKRYVEAFHKASNDPIMRCYSRIYRLIKHIFWSIIVKLRNVNLTKEQFDDELSQIYLKLMDLLDNDWSSVVNCLGNQEIDFKNLDKSSSKIQGWLKCLGGDIIALLGLGYMLNYWKFKRLLNDLNLAEFFTLTLQKITLSTPVEAIEMTATLEPLLGKGVKASLSKGLILKGLADCLGVAALVSEIMGAVIETTELDKQLDKINSAKSDFNTYYNTLVFHVQDIIKFSELIRKPELNSDSLSGGNS